MCPLRSWISTNKTLTIEYTAYKQFSRKVPKQNHNQNVCSLSQFSCEFLILKSIISQVLDRCQLGGLVRAKEEKLESTGQTFKIL